MRVGVIDVGSNTARLLVARVSRSTFVPVGRERAVLSLGEEVERTGRISDIKLARLAAQCEEFVRTAGALGASQVRVVVTAPGRQAENREALISTLRHATGLGVRVLSPEEEGMLAFTGAVTCAERVQDPVAVCDVGGGSTEVVVGTTDGGAAYVRAVGIGSLRLACRTLSYERPSKRELARARGEVEAAFDRFLVPLPKSALATGGTARALRRMVGRTLEPDALDAALRLLRRCDADQIVQVFGVPPHRVRFLAAGTLILNEVYRRLGVPLNVARGGLREGAALELLGQLEAA
ncbi:MAG: hypothetical protein OXG37_12795 [Actinomycetia bacterium]|nr:hypothetical protein [Actinomycetes bacterium]